MLRSFSLTFLFILLTGLQNVEAKEQIRVVGSSTIFPFIASIAEEFSRLHPFRTPIVESLGSGTGFKMFCSGMGKDTPDITTSSRAMKEAERELCKRNKVDNIIELLIGYDGIVIANSNQAHKFDFSIKDLFDSLSAYSQEGDKLVKNHKESWAEMDRTFPDTRIEIYGPHQNTGTYDTIINFIMLDQYACMNTRAFKEAYKKQEERKKVCSHIRDDGRYIEVGNNENIIIQKLVSNTNALGILSFSFLKENQNRIQGSTIAGVEPTYENISSGKYILARPLYLYIKRDHIDSVDGLKAFIREIVDAINSEKSTYLFRRGLIPLSREEMRKISAMVNDIT